MHDKQEQHHIDLSMDLNDGVVDGRQEEQHADEQRGITMLGNLEERTASSKDRWLVAAFAAGNGGTSRRNLGACTTTYAGAAARRRRVRCGRRSGSGRRGRRSTSAQNCFARGNMICFRWGMAGIMFDLRCNSFTWDFFTCKLNQTRLTV